MVTLTCRNWCVVTLKLCPPLELKEWDSSVYFCFILLLYLRCKKNKLVLIKMNKMRFMTAVVQNTTLKLNTRTPLWYVLIWAGKTQAWEKASNWEWVLPFPIMFCVDFATESWSSPRSTRKSYEGHIWSDWKNRFLGREFTLGQCEIPRAYMTSNSLPSPARICNVPLPSEPLPSCVCLFITMWFRNPDLRMNRKSTRWPPKHSQESHCSYMQRL